MKKWITKLIVFFAVITGVLGTPVICHAEENKIPVYAEDIKDGTYPIEVDSSSSMFRVVKAQLTVKEGTMEAVLTLSGKGYLKLYMGTGEQAAAAKETEYIPFLEDAEGAYTYRVPVEALNCEQDCAAFSKRKEKWYDRQLVFLAETLPQEALLKPLRPATLEVKDGSYTMEVSLAGGSGRAGIVSPADITVTEHTGMASIQWDSPNYDYMIVNGEKILQTNTEGNSVFEIPIWQLDQEMTVLADTTAMSVPHEIEYTLTFHSDTLRKRGGGWIFVAGAAGILSVVIVLRTIWKKKKKGFVCTEKEE